MSSPSDGIVELAGPERAPLAEFAASWLGAHDDPRSVVVTPDRQYFGAPADDHTLVPEAGARLGSTCFEAWLAANTQEAAA
ncbi:hypothetical protein [Novosphingobium olei]|uniref:hypothetical protein n=1 Tax=Novosphingobium olei TaxID=2728851 RepID=UPI0030933C2E|nr:hypothetical protein NSDW_04340 [Novosphingobium olei]